MTTRRSRILATTGAVAAAGLLGSTLILGSFMVNAPAAQAAPYGGSDRFPISVEEMDAKRAEIFANVDTNGDGLISAEEFAAAELPERQGRGKRGGNRGDMSTRGGLSDEQVADRIAAMEDDLFHALDTDADGVISRDEFSRSAMKEAMADGRKAKMFERADQDGDGYLSPDEFLPRRLAQLDANGDGEITRDEMPRRYHRQGYSQQGWNSDAD